MFELNALIALMMTEIICPDVYVLAPFGFGLIDSSLPGWH